MTERGFEGLDCYQLALQAFREAYEVATRLPAIERYNLTDHLRRAATSSTLNIPNCPADLPEFPNHESRINE